MLKNLLKTKHKKAVRHNSDARSHLYKVLFEYLISCIPASASATQLVQLGHKVPEKKKEEVFNTYLLFEKYLTAFQSEQFTRASLRENIRQRFPGILQEPIFNILFVSETEQKNILATEFLRSFFRAVGDKFGRAGEGYIDKKVKELAVLQERIKEVEIFRKLQFLSFEVFKFVGSNYGEPLAGKIFEKTYETFSGSYKELESFPYMLTLIPKEIVDREHLGIFTQAQIEQVFLEKLAESEQLNIALDQKIKENEQTQKLLRKNEVMLSSVISSALDAIVITNQEGSIIQRNNAYSNTAKRRDRASMLYFSSIL